MSTIPSAVSQSRWKRWLTPRRTSSTGGSRWLARGPRRAARSAWSSTGSSSKPCQSQLSPGLNPFQSTKPLFTFHKSYIKCVFSMPWILNSISTKSSPISWPNFCVFQNWKLGQPTPAGSLLPWNSLGQSAWTTSPIPWETNRGRVQNGRILSWRKIGARKTKDDESFGTWLLVCLGCPFNFTKIFLRIFAWTT